MRDETSLQHAFPFLHGSDVDNTMTGSGEGIARYVDFCRDTTFFRVLSSGRFALRGGEGVESILDTVEREGIPRPHVLTGGLGTEIFWLEEDSGEYHRDEGWLDGISLDQDGIDRVMGDFSGAAAQPPQFQSARKRSFYLEDGQSVISQIEEKLAQAGIDANVIYSSGRDLDIMPVLADGRPVNKGTALAYVAEKVGIGPERIVWSGDSMNDAGFADSGAALAVLPSNAHAELISSLQEARKDVHLATCPHAEGVVEGLNSFARRILGIEVRYKNDNFLETPNP